MFDDVHPQYTIGLVTIIKGQSHAGQVIMRGPYFLVFRGYAAGSMWVSRASGNRSRVCWWG